MRASGVVGVLVLSLVAIGAQAADVPAFTAAGKTCSDITWQPAVLARYPNVAKACQGVVERSGKAYVMFKGTVQRRAGARGLYIKFDGGDRAVLVKPPADLVAHIGNQTLRVRDSLPGQDLTVYMPSDRFVASFGDETAVETDVAIDDVIPVAEVEAMTDEAPPAEAPAPTPAPESLPVAATPVVPTPLPATTMTPTPAAPQSKRDFFFMVAGVALVIIVLTWLVMRRR